MALPCARFLDFTERRFPIKDRDIPPKPDEDPFFFLTAVRVLHILPPSSVLEEGRRLSQQLS
jgi:hypothetical protein